jgi:putative salt-induced outer membrane protein
VITSEENTSVLNDLALSVALNESLSLRTSLQTEYLSDPGTEFVTGDDGVVDEVEREDIDNTLGVAVVYSF